MVITAVDELPVESALSRVPAWAVAHAAPHTRRYYAYYNLLAGSPNETVRVGVESYDGKQQTVVLRRKGSSTDASPAVRGQRGPDGLAYIAVDALVGQDAVAVFDQLLDGMLDTPGLILDLRGNGGGNSSLGDQMVGRLITQTVIYGRECYRASHPMHLWTTGCTSVDTSPRGRPYPGRVAVLIDNKVHSSSEWMAAALCDTGRARCFGRTTAGDSGNPVFFLMPDVTVQFSTGIFSRTNGVLLNGVGIAPHVEIEWTLEDVRQGRDPDLEAARTWLLESAR
jgi:carboxyl-terminal processing protease